MAATSRIEWTDATWNPITGCSVVSPGCTNCYAMKLAGGRLKNLPSRVGLTQPSKSGPVWTGEVRLNEAWLTQPLHWRQPKRIFVCAHGDLFHEAVPEAWIDKVFAVMALSRHHTFQVLTKRSARMRAYLDKLSTGWVLRLSKAINEIGTEAVRAADAQGRAHPRWPLPNVWLGVSVEDQRHADERLPDLIATPAAIRFVSAEPLLSGISMRWALSRSPIEIANGFLKRAQFAPGLETLRGIDQVIVGGESGPRPMHPDWVRRIRADCAVTGRAFFFKQWGSWISVLDRDTQDPDWRADYPQYEREGCRWLNLAGGIGFHGDRLQVMRKVGKHHAGRLLDGVEHNGMPG